MQDLAEFVTIHAGHHQVECDQVRFDGSGYLHSLKAVIDYGRYRINSVMVVSSSTIRIFNMDYSLQKDDIILQDLSGYDKHTNFSNSSQILTLEHRFSFLDKSLDSLLSVRMPCTVTDSLPFQFQLRFECVVEGLQK